jgi:hypothetical protein
MSAANKRMFEIFEKLKAGLEQSFRTNFLVNQKQSSSLHCDQPSQANSMLSDEKLNRLQRVLDETIKLSIKICVADAVHDNTIAEKVKNLQARSLPLMNLLTEQVQSITDRASMLRCKRTCEQLMEEVRMDVLSLPTDMPTDGVSSTRSTVTAPPANARARARPRDTRTCACRDTRTCACAPKKTRARAPASAQPTRVGPVIHRLRFITEASQRKIAKPVLPAALRIGPSASTHPAGRASPYPAGQSHAVTESPSRRLDPRARPCPRDPRRRRRPRHRLVP